jgi:hypothetical protein
VTKSAVWVIRGHISDQVESRSIKSGFKDLEVIRSSSELIALSNENQHRTPSLRSQRSSGCSHPPAGLKRTFRSTETVEGMKKRLEDCRVVCQCSEALVGQEKYSLVLLQFLT